MVQTHTENFSILAQLESVLKLGELKCEENERRKKEKHSRSNFGDFQIPKKNFNIGRFQTRIFAIRWCVPTEAIEVSIINRDGSMPKFQPIPIPILEFSCQPIPILIPILEFPNYF